MFNFGDNVDRDKLSPVCTDGRQSRNYTNINEDRLVEVNIYLLWCMSCAASNGAPNRADCVSDVYLQQLQL